MSIEKLVRPEIAELKAYHVPDSKGMVKLDAMENPYALPEKLQRELADVLSRVELNRYPEPSPRKLRELLAQKMGVPSDMEIILGNGSDELLQIVTIALGRPGATVMYPAPTFVMYSMYARFFGMKAVPMPVREDFSFDAGTFIARMQVEQPAIVFISYPNNPTGLLYPEKDVADVVRAAPGLVVVDEAYHAFAGRTFMERLAEFPNLVVLRTVSKLGLAGIRLGYLAGRPEWIEQLNKVRSPYNINVLTQAAALFLLERLEVLEEQAARIRADRDSLAKALAGLPGVTVFPSQANFLLVRVPDADGAFAGLLRQGVLVKNLNGPAMKNCLRITIGTPDENRILLNALRGAL
jgi:histidinol-phosphate aminotransferase